MKKAALSVLFIYTAGCSLLVPDITFGEPEDAGVDDGTSDQVVDGDSPAGAFFVVRTEPLADAEEVGTRQKIEVEFTEPVDPSTVSADTFQVMLADGPTVSSRFELAVENDKAVSLTPLESLGPFREYVILIGEDVRSINGSSLQESTRIAFTTGEATWTSPQPTEQSSSPAFPPELEMDERGNGLSVWAQGEITAGSIDIAFNEFSPVEGWASARLVGGGPLREIDTPTAMASSGGAVAAWLQPAASNDLWAGQFRVGSGWSIPERLEVVDEFVSDVDVAAGAAGEAIVVWGQGNTTASLWSNRYGPDTGWSGPSLVEMNSGVVTAPTVAMAPDGSAIVVWVQENGSFTDLMASWSSPDGSWVSEETLDRLNSTPLRPTVAMDGLGNGVALFLQAQAGQRRIWSNRFTAGIGWAGADTLSDGSGDAFCPVVRFRNDGTGLAAWNQGSGRDVGVFVVNYSTNNGWSEPRRLSDSESNASCPDLALDPAGHAIVVWSQGNEVQTVWASRMVEGQSPGSPRLIGPGNGGAPQVAMDGLGRGLVVWLEGTDVVGVRFD
ncbi:MAG: Ig-like domain-containing protein [Myxococcota bacterium]